MKLCFWNNEQICAASVAYDVGLPGHQWFDAPTDYNKDKLYKLEEGQVVELTITDLDPQRLRIYRVVPLRYTHEEVKTLIDFSILGFRKIAPHYDRGVKTKSEYKCADKDELIVRKSFTDIRDPITGRLTDLQVLFEWFAEDGSVQMTKTEIVKSFNKAQAETEERKRRERSIDFLISEARHTPLETIMDALITHYHDQQLLYKEKGSSDFADAINNETDATILAYLAIQVPFTSDPENYTIGIKESILYQLYDITEAQLIAALRPVV